MSDTKWTWEDVIKADSGKVFVDRFDDGLRFIIMRGPFHLCAYIGIPVDHPLSGFAYDDIPVEAHGGLTFSSIGRAGEAWLEGFYWYGWDYGHCDDYTIFSSHYSSYAAFNEARKKWGVAEVDEDSWTTRYEFKKLMILAEKIVAKARGEQ